VRHDAAREMLTNMPAISERGMTEQMLTGEPDIGYATLWPWSYRVAGAISSWPAVELYEAGSLLDVVTSTRLAAQVLRGSRAVRSAAGGRVLAWGRLPLSGGVPAVEFGRGGFRRSHLAVPPVTVTTWCWLAVADALYDSVTVRHDGTAARRRLRMSPASC
jgi:hypothetical protein